MPTIAPHYFNVRLSSTSGDTYSHKAEVSVNSKGEFAVRIPKELADACEEVAKDRVDVRVRDDKRGTAVFSNDKTVAVKLIEDAIRIYSTAETTEEIVILYAHDFDGKYLVGPNGEIATDGYDSETNYGTTGQQRIDDNWKWSKEPKTHRFGNRETYQFGIGAQVYKKTVIKRKTGTTYEYDLYWGEDGDHFDRELYCQRLNSFGVNFALSHRGEKYSGYEIPYTEAAAKFFFDAMVGLCSLSERVSAFFADTENLQARIETRTTRLLG